MRNALINLKVFLLRFALVFFIYQICRVLFFLNNQSFLGEPTLSNWIGGARFDVLVVSILFLPLALFSFLPVNLAKFRVGKWIIWLLYVPLNAIAIAINVIDIEYFKFILKRSTADLITLINTGDDFKTLAPTFALDYWYWVLLFVFFVLLLHFFYIKTHRILIAQESGKSINWVNLSLLPLMAGLLVIGARGGLQLKPLNLTDAAKYGSASQIPLVLNSPFSFFKSLKGEPIEVPSNEELLWAEQHLSLCREIPTVDDSLKLDNPNIVILILESFAAEYIGFYNPNRGFTPFLDSLLSESLTFKYAFANGRKSIEAMPSIVLSLPQLMEAPFIGSAYSTNKVGGLVHSLKSKGYSASFFHGAQNGSMGFEGFTALAGFDSYFGLDQYPEPKKHYDKNWGIWDHRFFPWFARELNKQKEPFVSAFFSLSSHHPFKVPEEFENTFPKGNLPIHESIGYADYALKMFFEEAKNQAWFNNTLFVITADHGADHQYPEFTNIFGQYRIPLAFYHPNNKRFTGFNIENISQHVDITPTLLQITETPAKGKFFGNALMGSPETQKNDFYLWVYNFFIAANDSLFTWNKPNEVLSANRFKTDPHLKNNIVEQQRPDFELLHHRLKAARILYSNMLAKNEMLCD
jgi:phosphoglycerol transferase MdoB-like AlkP superfamily enzyme